MRSLLPFRADALFAQWVSTPHVLLMQTMAWQFYDLAVGSGEQVSAGKKFTVGRCSGSVGFREIADEV